MDDSQANQLSQRVEREVRTLIGDLHMQVIMLRAMLEQNQPQPGDPKPKPAPPPPQRPQPIPPQPEQEPKPEPKAANGAGYQERIAK